MGRPHSETVRLTPTGGLALRDRSRRQRRTSAAPPSPPEVIQEFIGRQPTETTIIRLCRASPAERTFLARRVIDRFLGYKPPKNHDGTSGPSDSITMETVQTMFLSVIAIRAGMNSRGRNGGDENVLRTMQNILKGCVTRGNARDVATMVQAARIDHISGSIDDRRATARPIMSRVLAHGFRAVVPEIRTVDGGLLVIATVTRGDPVMGWQTVSNMRVAAETVIPTGMLVLVPYPLPRPADIGPGSGRHATIVNDEKLVLVDPGLLPR